LIYSGERSLSTIAFSLKKLNRSDVFHINFGYGRTFNKFGGSMENLSAGLLTMTYYHKNKSAEKGLHWGWSNLNGFNWRSHNGFPNYSLRTDYFTAFGPALRHLLPFQWKKQQFQWTNNAYIHGVGFKIQSDFIGGEPRGFTQEDRKLVAKFWSSSDWFLLGKDWSMGYWSTLCWQLPSDNSLGFQYRLQLARVDGWQPVSRVASTYLLVLNVNLW
ncbi:MAG: hypothetical protein WDZ72_02100, partial [Cyclobacteriaceae bacterium]